MRKSLGGIGLGDYKLNFQLEILSDLLKQFESYILLIRFNH